MRITQGIAFILINKLINKLVFSVTCYARCRQRLFSHRRVNEYLLLGLFRTQTAIKQSFLTQFRSRQQEGSLPAPYYQTIDISQDFTSKYLIHSLYSTLDTAYLHLSPICRRVHDSSRPLLSNNIIYALANNATKNIHYSNLSIFILKTPHQGCNR